MPLPQGSGGNGGIQRGVGGGMGGGGGGGGGGGAPNRITTLETVAAVLDGVTPLHCAALRGNPSQVWIIHPHPLIPGLG